MTQVKPNWKVLRDVGEKQHTLEAALHQVRLLSPQIVMLQNRDENVRLQYSRHWDWYRWWSADQGSWVTSTQEQVLAANRHWSGPYRVVLHA